MSPGRWTTVKRRVKFQGDEHGEWVMWEEYAVDVERLNRKLRIATQALEAIHKAGNAGNEGREPDWNSAWRLVNMALAEARGKP